MIAVRNGSHITIFDSSSGVQLADLELGADMIVQEMVFSADGFRLAAQVDTVAGPTVQVWFDGRTDENMTQ